MGLRRRLLPALIALFALTALPVAAQPVDHGGSQDDGAPTAAADESGGLMDRINEALEPVDAWWKEWINDPIGTVFFWDVWFWDNETSTDEAGEEVVDKHIDVPLAVLWLVLGAIFFTLRMGFINFRAFGHAINVTRGKYDNPEDEGEVSHFKALSTALSATVGLGNIAGVAIAISIGGPGATFWMIVAGLLGMSAKFTECTLGQQFREVRPDGRIMGGAMYYLSKGLKERKLGGLGMVLAVFFAILCIGGSLAGGNSFQVNQSLNAIKLQFDFLGDYPWVYGLFMTVIVGFVILGGIKRIATTAAAVVPLMCVVYVLMALAVILMNTGQIGWAFGQILGGAFSVKAGFGGFIGVLVVGFQRAAFSNEAGIGSAAIAHSAAKTKYPVREGIVSLLEPFIDTVIVCTMTALVIVITGAFENTDQAFVDARDTREGAALTLLALRGVSDLFPWVLCAAVMLFAFSTMISWSYYGERCWAWLFGDGSSLIYRLLFLAFAFLGSVITAKNVLDFGDLMILGMALPNILGVILLSGRVRRELDDYWSKFKAGEFKTFK
ncbi:MAG: alanine/glycine:cation symporter family protein [Planctomycetota bacterium]|nr:alanine/glycine:cation symporter family protein [Planctomycetota bacterium]